MTDNTGVYVNQFFNSRLDLEGYKLHLETNFPLDGSVKITILGDQGGREYDLRIRIPQWVPGAVPLLLNGKDAGEGRAGSYFTLRRSWREGDTITFTLPFILRPEEYTGFDQDNRNRRRYALQYGPILLALTGNFSEKEIPQLSFPIEDLEKNLIPQGNLRFDVKAHKGYRYIPYYEVQDEVFTCFPIIGI
jgi:DUF1680 family protein